jgi:hypothetical protein
MQTLLRCWYLDVPNATAAPGKWEENASFPGWSIGRLALLRVIFTIRLAAVHRAIFSTLIVHTHMTAHPDDGSLRAIRSSPARLLRKPGDGCHNVYGLGWVFEALHVLDEAYLALCIAYRSTQLLP